MNKAKTGIVISLVLFFNIVLLFGNALGENNFTGYQFVDQFGGKGSGNGQLLTPHSIDIDKDGNIYVTDTGNNRVEKYSSNGNF
ncbi:MAG TPA: SBBP repeat-containing protein, partial [Nitrososphaeraceae archaeon]|nr:SBBP repeat-containing protein [Nitrososphaeraceae archaeon]